MPVPIRLNISVDTINLGQALPPTIPLPEEQVPGEVLSPVQEINIDEEQHLELEPLVESFEDDLQSQALLNAEIIAASDDVVSPPSVMMIPALIEAILLFRTVTVNHHGDEITRYPSILLDGEAVEADELFHNGLAHISYDSVTYVAAANDTHVLQVHDVGAHFQQHAIAAVYDDDDDDDDEQIPDLFDPFESDDDEEAESERKNVMDSP